MYEFVSLRAEDERAEQARMVAEKENETNVDDVELQDGDCWWMIIYLVRILCSMTEKTLQ